MLRLSLIIILSYLVGSIPTGILVGRRFAGIDIREKGSGNTGSTNAFRVLGWKGGLLVQLIDIAKGAFAVLVITRLFDGLLPFANRTPFEDITLVRMIAVTSAVVGHIWTCFAAFRGGKGINTALGALAAVSPLDTGIALAVFLLVVLTSGYVSLGSVSAAFAFPASLLARYNIFRDQIDHYQTLVLCSLALSLLLFYAHRANIARLMRGTENRFNNLRIFRRR